MIRKDELEPEPEEAYDDSSCHPGRIPLKAAPTNFNS
jgi:hypothetical protein